MIDLKTRVEPQEFWCMHTRIHNNTEDAYFMSAKVPNAEQIKLYGYFSVIEKSWADAEIAKRDKALEIAVKTLAKYSEGDKEILSLWNTNIPAFRLAYGAKANEAMKQIEEVLK